MKRLSLMYRGHLSSCNYGCPYCPFAKRQENLEQKLRDRQALQKFVEWVTFQQHIDWNIFFTPWGEALTRSWYRQAIIELTAFEHVNNVAVQTNLACSLNWLSKVELKKFSLWITYHPSQITYEKFLTKIQELHLMTKKFSVGMVGLPEYVELAETLRADLPPDTYLWINPQQPRKRPYASEIISRFKKIDPQFDFTLSKRPTRDQYCPTGEFHFTVDGRGGMRRCHFVEEVIGNIYESHWEECLMSRNCPNKYCHCYLGLKDKHPEEIMISRIQ